MEGRGASKTVKGSVEPNRHDSHTFALIREKKENASKDEDWVGTREELEAKNCSGKYISLHHLTTAYSTAGRSRCTQECLSPNIVPSHNDVLCGRGAGICNHSGNIAYQKLVKESKLLYLSLPHKYQKTNLTKAIIHSINHQTPPGRFLAKDKETNEWYELDNFQAVMKVSQALRENGPKLKKMSEKLKMDTCQQQGLQKKLFPWLKEGMIMLETEDSKYLKHDEEEKQKGPYTSRKKLLTFSEFSKKKKRISTIIDLLHNLQQKSVTKSQSCDLLNTPKEVACKTICIEQKQPSQHLVGKHDFECPTNGLLKMQGNIGNDSTGWKNNEVLQNKNPSTTPLTGVDAKIPCKPTSDQQRQSSFYLPSDSLAKAQKSCFKSNKEAMLSSMSSDTSFFSLPMELQRSLPPPYHLFEEPTAHQGQDSQMRSPGLKVHMDSFLCHYAPSVLIDQDQISMKNSTDKSVMQASQTPNVSSMCTPDILTSSMDIDTKEFCGYDKMQRLIPKDSSTFGTYNKPIKFTVRRMCLHKKHRDKKSGD